MKVEAITIYDWLAVTAWDRRPITVRVAIRWEHAHAKAVLLSAPLFTFYEWNGRGAKNLEKQATMISVGTRFMKNGKLFRIAEIRRPLGTYRIFLSENQSGEKAVMSPQDIGEWWDDLDEGELWNMTLPESSSETAVRMVTRPRSTTGNVNNTVSAPSESADELSDNEAIDIVISKPRVSSIDNPIPSTSYDTIPGPSTKSTPARFVKITSSDVDQAIKSTENKSTMRKTAGHIKLLRQFMIENGDNREILSLSIEELDDTLSRYFLSVRKPDGTDYEPVTLRNQLGSFDRYLRQHDYGGQGVTLIGKDSQFKKNKVIPEKQAKISKIRRARQPTNEIWHSYIWRTGHIL